MQEISFKICLKVNLKLVMSKVPMNLMETIEKQIESMSEDEIQLEDIEIDAQSLIRSETFDVEPNAEVDKIYYNQAKDFKWHSAVRYNDNIEFVKFIPK